MSKMYTLLKASPKYSAMSGIQRPLQILYQDAKYFCISKPAKCAIQGKPYQEQGQNWQQLVKGGKLHARHALYERADDNSCFLSFVQRLLLLAMLYNLFTSRIDLML